MKEIRQKARERSKKKNVRRKRLKLKRNTNSTNAIQAEQCNTRAMSDVGQQMQGFNTVTEDDQIIEEVENLANHENDDVRKENTRLDATAANGAAARKRVAFSKKENQSSFESSETCKIWNGLLSLVVVSVN